MLIQADLGRWQAPLREALGAGEPLNPEVIEQVRRPGASRSATATARPRRRRRSATRPASRSSPARWAARCPGYAVVLVDPVTGEPADEGEIASTSRDRPLGLMIGYRDAGERNAAAMAGGYYHTGDVASRDADGYITYVGRTDDVFKASDYRISPFELESVLIEHAAVAEAAVVPVAGPGAAGRAQGVRDARGRPRADARDGARRSCAIAREHLAPYKRIRRLEFAELPKTISGKIRRVELRAAEHARRPATRRRPARTGRVLGGGLPGAASLPQWATWNRRR